MARTDIEWVGRAINVKTNNGTTPDGRAWTLTSFLLERPKMVKGEMKTEKWSMGAFSGLPVTEGDLFRVGIDLERRKKKNSEEWETALIVRWVEAYPEENEVPKKAPTSSPKANTFSSPRPQAQPQSTGFSSTRPSYRNEAPTPSADYSKEQGPEMFSDDDIPF